MPSDIELRVGGAREPGRHRLHSAMVAAATLLSGVAYVLTSRELRYELQANDYKQALLGQFMAERGLSDVTLLRPVAVQGVLLVAAWLAACVLAGLAMRRALRGRGGAVETMALALASTVLPAMLVATVRWPDGQGVLHTGVLLAVTAFVALFATLVAMLRMRRATAHAPAATPDASDPPDTLPSPVVAPMVAAPTAPRGHDPGRGWALVLLLAMVPLVMAVWWNGVDAIRGFDSLADHLPRAARWLRLSRLTDESGTLLTPYYPGNFQLVVRWVLLLGTDAYAFVPSLLAGVLCLACLYLIAREIGQPRWTAMVVATAAASCSLVPYLATTVEADLPTTAFLLLALLALMRWLRWSQAAGGTDDTATADLAPLAAMGACLGLATGTKYSALPPALAIGAVAAFCALRRSHGIFPGGRRYLNARSFVILLAAMIVPALACGGYWLVRNTVEHGNPLFPVATAGLPGVDVRLIIPVKPSLTGSLLARATYPWAHWDFVTPYDDGFGAAFATVALVGFVVMAFRRPAPGSRRRLVWWVTLAAYALWLGTGSITARFGLFPVLLTYVFIGELWREFESVPLKLVTLASVLLGVGLVTRSLLVGAVYTTLMPTGMRGVPTAVDSLAPTRIFNATTAANRYALLGRDYRHEVITMFGPARPADLDASGAAYALFTAAQVAEFDAPSRAMLVARGPGLPSGDTLSLWRLRAFDLPGRPAAPAR